MLVFTSDSSRVAAKELAGKLPTPTGFVQTDLSQGPEAAAAIVEGARAHHEAHLKHRPRFQVDILINNAGVSFAKQLNDPSGGTITPADYSAMHNVNVVAPLLLVQAIQPYLPTDRSGRIVNVSSTASSVCNPGGSLYSSSKAALEAMTRVWAKELVSHATVNAINPGPVWTDMWLASRPNWHRMQPLASLTPLAEYGIPGNEEYDAAIRAALDRQQPGEGARFDAVVRNDFQGRRPAIPEEIAGTIDMLCSDGASWTTGSVVCANGGMRMTIA